MSRPYFAGSRAHTRSGLIDLGRSCALLFTCDSKLTEVSPGIEDVVEAGGEVEDGPQVVAQYVDQLLLLS